MLKQLIHSIRECVDELLSEKMVTHYITGVSKIVFIKDGAAHRDGDKPARIFFDRETRRVLREEYCKNGTVCREDGKPAIILYNDNGNVETYLNRAECIQNKPCCKAFLASLHHG